MNTARTPAKVLTELARVERGAGVVLVVELLEGSHDFFVKVSQATDRGAPWTPSIHWQIYLADELRPIGEALLRAARTLERQGVLGPPRADELGFR